LKIIAASDRVKIYKNNTVFVNIPKQAALLAIINQLLTLLT
jgi:hypothetical protein